MNTNLAQWRQQRAGEWMELPSGLVAFLAPVTLIDLAAQDGIPTPLYGAAQQVVSQGEATTNTLASIKGAREALALVAKAACKEPLIVDVVTDPKTQVATAELPAYDLLAIYNHASRGLAPLRPFRGESDTTPNV